MAGRAVPLLRCQHWPSASTKLHHITQFHYSQVTFILHFCHEHFFIECATYYLFVCFCKHLLLQSLLYTEKNFFLQCAIVTFCEPD